MPGKAEASYTICDNFLFFPSFLSAFRVFTLSTLQPILRREEAVFHSASTQGWERPTNYKQISLHYACLQICSEVDFKSK